VVRRSVGLHCLFLCGVSLRGSRCVDVQVI
jgi:hypothetical protein